MFVEKPFTIARTWKQLKYLSMEEWIKKCGTYIYDGILLLSHKKERMLFAATWMHLEITIISEVSQIDKYYMILLIHGLWKKWHRWTYSHKCRKQINDYQGQKGNNLGYWDWQTHTTVFKIHNYLELTIYHKEVYSILCNDLFGNRI